ncbi:MAG: signal peptidase II [Pseudomonadota bacterium]
MPATPPTKVRRSALILGALVVLIALVIDQASKYWFLHIYDIAEKSPVAVTPFFNFVMVWNYGISYGLFQQDTDFGRYALVAVKIVVSIGLTVWMVRTHDRLIAVSLGLIIGGAIGNAIDRVVYGAVADFFHFYVGSFSWYVFNLADVAVVAGVTLLLYDSFLRHRGQDRDGRSSEGAEGRG